MSQPTSFDFTNDVLSINSAIAAISPTATDQSENGDDRLALTLQLPSLSVRIESPPSQPPSLRDRGQVRYYDMTAEGDAFPGTKECNNSVFTFLSLPTPTVAATPKIVVTKPHQHDQQAASPTNTLSSLSNEDNNVSSSGLSALNRSHGSRSVIIQQAGCTASVLGHRYTIDETRAMSAARTFEFFHKIYKLVLLAIAIVSLATPGVSAGFIIVVFMLNIVNKLCDLMKDCYKLRQLNDEKNLLLNMKGLDCAELVELNKQIYWCKIRLSYHIFSIILLAIPIFGELFSSGVEMAPWLAWLKHIMDEEYVHYSKLSIEILVAFCLHIPPLVNIVYGLIRPRKLMSEYSSVEELRKRAPSLLKRGLQLSPNVSMSTVSVPIPSPVGSVVGAATYGIGTDVADNDKPLIFIYSPTPTPRKE